MRLGDIKAEALRLMGVITSAVSYLDIDGFKSDKTIAGYVLAMPQPINRAIDRMVVKGAITKPTERITVATKEDYDLNDMGIDETLCALIPLYIVGDVYANDEAQTASSSRNEFESALNEYVGNMQQGEVDIIYRGE